MRFLECRADEMAPGGRLLIAVPARNEQYWTGAGVYDLLHDACVDLVREGRIDGPAYQRALMPVYFRSLDELLRPFNRPRHRFTISLRLKRRVATKFPRRSWSIISALAPWIVTSTSLSVSSRPSASRCYARRWNRRLAPRRLARSTAAPSSDLRCARRLSLSLPSGCSVAPPSVAPISG